MGNKEKNLDFFVAGGALPPDSPSYIERPADDELFNAILAHQFGCILAKHGIGKSSLATRTAWRLQQQGISTATLVMSGITAQISMEQLSLWLINRLKAQLNLSVDPYNWWASQTHLDGGRPFINFLKNVVLSEVEGPVVIFIDEVNDTTAHREFFDALFTAIQSIYDTSAKEAVYEHLTFVLLGTNMLADLAKNHNQALFRSSQLIALHDFTRAEVQSFEQGMLAAEPKQREAILDRVFLWTGGHPYLSQKLCLAMVSNPHWNDAWVDRLVYRLFSSTEIRAEPNLYFVSESIELSPQRRALLTLYRDVYQDKHVPEDMKSRDQRKLKFVGLVKSEKGTLKIHNEIYRRVFDVDWINANMPINWTRLIAVTSMVIAMVLAGIFGVSVYQQRQAETQVQNLVDNFRDATKPEERIISLAAMFNFGFEDRGRTFFYEELSPTDRLALFNLADPHTVGEQVVTVVKGVYVDSALKNDDQSAALLDAMANTLAPLESNPSLGAIELRLEIIQWLKGRDFSQNQERYQKAIAAYNIAMQFNDHNPGTFFDRAVAYANLGDTNQALTDFETVLNLDESWHTRVKETLVSNAQLYGALWIEQQGEYGALVALVPTPTHTPIPTDTPTLTATPTSSPTPIPTNTPLPSTPTATPTTTATPTSGIPTPTPTATLTPTPSIPSGTFTLLNPSTVDDPSYGPTDFEWEWTGSLPSGYGFEVRVWREGEFPAGVHNAVLDNQNGNIQTIGNNRYRLSVDISGAAGVQGQSGEYLWTVALVQISPSYAELGQQAEPGQVRYAAPGRSGDGDSGDDGSSGGVGID